MPAFEYEQTDIRIALGDEVFAAKGKVIKSAGWKAVYEEPFDDEEEGTDIREQILPELAAKRAAALNNSA